MNWEMVPVGMHLQNAAKKIQTFKGHFKYILCVVADEFPMNMWDRLIPQVELTCNLIHHSIVAQTCRPVLTLSAPHLTGGGDYR